MVEILFFIGMELLILDFFVIFYLIQKIMLQPPKKWGKWKAIRQTDLVPLYYGQNGRPVYLHLQKNKVMFRYKNNGKQEVVRCIDNRIKIKHSPETKKVVIMERVSMKKFTKARFSQRKVIFYVPQNGVVSQ